MNKTSKNTKQILLLTYNSDTAENKLMDSVNQSYAIETRCVFKSRNIVFRAIRRVIIERQLPGMRIWMGSWKYEIDNYKLIVIVASRYSPFILRWLHRKYPRIRLINYYWDKVCISGFPVEKSTDFENWSFDLEDCRTYGFFYNPQYYSKYMKLPDRERIYDVSFVGADREGLWRDRIKIVNNIYKKLKSYGFRLFFYLVSDHATEVDKDIVHSKRMSEGEFLDVVSKSRAVLDIIQPGKEWMTLRPLLALSNGRKVITNYTGIVQYEFYNSHNIFILDRDSYNDIGAFLNSPFVEYKAGELETYEAEKWGKRFFADLSGR